MVSALSSYAGSALSISRLDKNPTLTKNLKLQNEQEPAEADGKAAVASLSKKPPTTPLVDKPTQSNPADALSSGSVDLDSRASKGLTLLFNAISTGLGNGDGNITSAEINGFFDRVGENPEAFGLDQAGYESLRESITDVFTNISKISGSEGGVTRQDFVDSVINSEDKGFFNLTAVIQFANAIAARSTGDVLTGSSSGDTTNNYVPPVVPIGGPTPSTATNAGDPVDAYKDPVVPIGDPDAAGALSDLFNGIDPNSDGIITQKDLEGVFSDLETRFPDDSLVSSLKTQLTEFFNNADSGNDGVRFNEFVEGVLGDSRAYTSLISLYNRVA